jgi:protein-L-isoaspartate(D-aspartate) O-methyltransferase
VQVDRLRARFERWAWRFTLVLISAITLACNPPERTPHDVPNGAATTTTAEVARDDGASWHRPRSDEMAAERRAMVARQIAARDVSDPHVIAAMRNVPRHWFVPDALRRDAYDDRPLPIGEDQTISQPYIVAFMTEALRLTPDDKVLEIGTGSGYQAAVLAEITPHVFTIEIVEPLGRRAMAVFEQRGYETVRARIGDGYAGWPEHAPFEAIIVTCAPDHIPPKLVEQLAVGGRICIPVGAEYGFQELIRVTKQADGTLMRESLLPVRFVPMTGDAQRKRD